MLLLKVVIFCLCAGTVLGMAEKCCQLGMNEGAQTILGDDISCRIENKVFDRLKEELNLKDNLQSLMCKGFYKQCCITAAKSQYCTIGMVFGNTNQVCMRGRLEPAGDSQRLCCDCCKSGRKAGAERANCDDVNFDYKNVDELCTHAYRDCCNKIKKELPVEPTKAPATKTCKDIKCDINSTVSCTETSKGPQCICKAGYVAKNDHVTCIDINECERDQNICGGVQKCTNTNGSYTCACDKGFKFVNKQCIKMTILETQCKQGFESVNGSCVDVDECTTKKHKCPFDMLCLNTEGSYRCTTTADCAYPYYEQQYHHGASFCKDVNECLNPNTCQKYTHECINQIGSHICKQVRCLNGLRLIDGYCVDINECEEEKGICGEKGRCRNVRGTYYCDCQLGYRIDSTTRKCADIDECKLGRASCSYRCVNTEGSYRCTCPSGYESRGAYCHDKNECKAQKPACTAGEYCFNTFGSYRCIDESCPSPYYVRAAKKNNPDSCWKSCPSVSDKNERSKCYQEKSFASVKRAAFKFEKEIVRFNNGTSEFNFHYWWSFSTSQYEVDTRLEKGNEEGFFGIERVTGESELRIVNKQTIAGHQEFQIVMVTEVTQRGKSKPSWRYQYHIYVHVSEFQFR